jgi:hypothetical protein
MNIDWGNKIINVFKTDMIQIQVVPSEIWQLDIPEFKKSLGDALDDELGMIYPNIFNHNPEVSVGGTVLAKVVEILDPYTITFEDGQYAVNLVGANSNIGDRVNVNQVSVRSSNSAGMQVYYSNAPASITPSQIAEATWTHQKGDMVYQRSIGGFRKNYTLNQIIMLNDDGTDGVAYNCFDRFGNPSLTSVDRMEKV